MQANARFKITENDSDLRASLDLYKKALDIAPWYAEAWYNQSLAQEEFKDFDAAAKRRNSCAGNKRCIAAQAQAA